MASVTKKEERKKRITEVLVAPFYAAKTRVLDGLCKYCDDPPLPKYIHEKKPVFSQSLDLRTKVRSMRQSVVYDR
jgi:hypothetical protein